MTFLDSSSDQPGPATGSPEPIASREGVEQAGKIALGEIFSIALEIYRKNPIMIVPSLVPIAGLILGLIAFAGFVGLAVVFGERRFLAFTAFGGILLFAIILIILFITAEGLTIEMVKEAFAGRKVELAPAWEASRGRIAPLIWTSVLAGIIIVLGYVLLIIPGLILTAIFYFVAQAVMIDGKSGTEALKASYGFLKANLEDSIVVILASVAISLLLPMIPFIGFLLSLIAFPYIYALSTLLYLGRKVKAAGEASEPT